MPRVAVSTAVPAAPATAQSSEAGLSVQSVSTAYSAWVCAAETEHVVADAHPGDALTDLVDHPGRIEAESDRFGQRLPAGSASRAAPCRRTG